MYKIYLSLLKQSQLKVVYISIYVLVTAIWLWEIVREPVNFSIIGFLNFNTLYITFIITRLLYKEEIKSNFNSYLSVLQTENELYIVKSFIIFKFSSAITLIYFILFNLIYNDELLVILQIIYFILMLVFNYLFVYMLQYIFKYTTNIVFSYAITFSIVAITFLAIFTRNIMVYSSVIAIGGVFFAMTIIIKRQLNELKMKVE